MNAQRSPSSRTLVPLAAALAILLSALPARAEVFFSYLASTDLSGESPFTSEVNAAPGQTVLVRCYIYWSYPGALYFGGGELSRIPILNFSPGDGIDLGVGDPALIGGGLIRSVLASRAIGWVQSQTFEIQDAGPTQRDIVTAPSTHPKITMLQDPASANPDYNTENPIWGMQLLYTPGLDTPARDIAIGGSAADMKFAAVYTNLNGANHVFKSNERFLVPATIHVAPTPGALGVCMITSLLTTRRRR